MESWDVPYQSEFESNLQSVASGSGISNLGMSVTRPAIAMPLPTSMSMIGGPQVNPVSMSGPQLGPMPFGGPQGTHRVLYGSGFDTSSRQSGNGGNDGPMEMRTI